MLRRLMCWLGYHPREVVLGHHSPSPGVLWKVMECSSCHRFIRVNRGQG